MIPIFRPPQSAASCRLSARRILKKNIWQAHLRKTTRNLIIYKGRHIFSHSRMPGTFSDCEGLPIFKSKLSIIRQNRVFRVISFLLPFPKGYINEIVTKAVPMSNIDVPSPQVDHGRFRNFHIPRKKSGWMRHLILLSVYCCVSNRISE